MKYINSKLSWFRNHVMTKWWSFFLILIPILVIVSELFGIVGLLILTLLEIYIVFYLE